jgi:uncharacterized protein YxjI
MLLERRTWFVRERVGVLKLTDTYDILDPETRQVVGIARDEPSAWSKYLRLIVKKHFLPTTVRVYEDERMPALLSIVKRPAFLRTRVEVLDQSGAHCGQFRSKLFSIGVGFWIHDASDRQVAEVKGDWKGWNFKLRDVGGREIGTITKKWAGLGKELLTSADSYVIALSETAPKGESGLLLAAGLAIDIVFKEQG